MINVSNEFKETMQERTDFRTRAIIKLADGTQLDALEGENFTLSNNSFTDAADVGTFPLGVAISRSIQLEFMNDDDKFSGYDFYGAEIALYLTFRLSTTTERIVIGAFTVVSPATIGDTIMAIATDDMHKADISYSADLTFPATAMEVLSDACTQCGITAPVSFANSDYIVNAIPEGYTCRQVIAAVAMIACGNARISRSGALEILSYDFSDNLNSDEARLKNWKNLRIDTDDIVITGVKTLYTRTITGEDGEETEEETTLLKGTEGYVISIENPLISGNEETAMNLISAPLIGAAFRKFEGDHIAYPLVEFMDRVEVQDRKGNVYNSFVTDINFTFFSFTTFKNSAESAVRQQSTYSSEAKSAVEKAEQLVKNEQNARDKAVAALSKALSESSGMYSSEEIQEDGSAIRYLHDKPTLAESENIIKTTADAIGFSTDGGETYPFGIQINGDVITRILSATGIEANWINGGTITGVTLNGEEIDISAEYRADQDDGEAPYVYTQIQTGTSSIDIAPKTTVFSNEAEMESASTGGSGEASSEMTQSSALHNRYIMLRCGNQREETLLYLYPNRIEIKGVVNFSNGDTPHSALEPDIVDLDDLKTPGFYVFTQESSQTIVNMPIGGTASGSVVVIPEGTLGQVRQQVTRCSAGNREIWERLWYNDAWSAWEIGRAHV